MVVNFYNCKSEQNVLDKALGLLKGGVSCQIKEPCSILEPRLILLASSIGNLSSCNYMYIQNLSRYYYVTDINMLNDGMVEVMGKVDPLMSFKSGIRGITCSIARQENKFNKYYVDSYMPIRNTRNVQYLKIGDLPASSSIYVTVDGGDY